MQAVVCVNCLGDKYLLHTKLISAALNNCSSSGSLTYLQIRGTTHVLITQTNLYKLYLYYLFNLKYYTYVSRPITILIYVTITYLLVTVCKFPSVDFVPYGLPSVSLLAAL